ncbi:hypothetical protein [Thiocystis violacea]|uniref:hypothetical protein n=1 Tax=Thiocystis violacea TaxID=13725 RepID=UPI00190613C2|nr:hypothetical protein [Thiocystis violacea]MBK1721507.1 hypothetical protein [Thiocystis violacea]
MLEPIHRLARWLARLRPLFILVGVVGVVGGLGVGIGLLAFSGREGDAWVMPALLAMLWAALALVFIDLFAHLPPWLRRASGARSPLLHASVLAIRWTMLAILLFLGATAVEISSYIAERWTQSQPTQGAR